MMGPFTASVRWDFSLIGPILLNIQTHCISLILFSSTGIDISHCTQCAQWYICESAKANSPALFICTAWFNYNHSSLSKCKQFVYKHDTTCWHFMLQGQQDLMPRTNVSFTTLSWEQTLHINSIQYSEDIIEKSISPSTCFYNLKHAN